MGEVGSEFFGVASSVKERMNAFCHLETCEKNFIGATKRRNWKRRSETAMRFGLQLPDGSLISPKNPFSIAEAREVYTASYASPYDLLSFLSREEVCSSRWSSILGKTE